MTRNEYIDALNTAKIAAREFAQQSNISNTEKSNRQTDVNTLVLMIEEQIEASIDES